LFGPGLASGAQTKLERLVKMAKIKEFSLQAFIYFFCTHRFFEKSLQAKADN
jgi:hypothetical protein